MKQSGISRNTVYVGTFNVTLFDFASGMAEDSLSLRLIRRRKYFILIKSERSGVLLLRNGFRYEKKRVNERGDITWRCVRRRREACSALIVTNGDRVIREETHKCAANMLENEIKIRISDCLNRVQEDTAPVSDIYAEVVREFNNSEFNRIGEMPPFKHFKSMLYRHRKKALLTKKTNFS